MTTSCTMEFHFPRDSASVCTMSERLARRAFDLAITHFDLANNYGLPYGSAEINPGRIVPCYPSDPASSRPIA